MDQKFYLVIFIAHTVIVISVHFCLFIVVDDIIVIIISIIVVGIVSGFVPRSSGGWMGC